MPAETRNRQNGAMLRAVEAALRSHLGDTVPAGTPGSIVGIAAPPGRPPTWAGNVWYSVFGRNMAGVSPRPTYHERTYGCGICITVRVNAKPQDRIGNALMLAIDEGLYDRVDDIAQYVHDQTNAYAIMHAANGYMRSTQTLGVDVEQGFTEPLIFQGATDPTEQGPAWFGADVTKQGSAAGAGYSVQLNFGGMTYTRPGT